MKKNYIEKFTEVIETNTPIYSSNDETKLFIPEDNEIFKQCWADTNTRKTLPKYWFISNHGNLISVCHDDPVWIEGYTDETGTRKCYKYIIHDENNATMQHKNIESHNLVALVFGSEVYGKAAELLEQEGVYSFGINNKRKLKAQGHHIDGDHTNNEPQNIQIVSNRVHPLLHSVPDLKNNLKKELQFMQRLADVVSEEEPHKITILFTGYYWDEKEQQFKNNNKTSIHATSSLNVTPIATEQIRAAMIGDKRNE